MSCEHVHRRLLALEDPALPPGDVSDHLAGCAACRSWHEHLVGLEREVPFLPVPPPERRTPFLRRLREAPSVLERPRLYGLSLNGKRERGQRKVAIAVALAASLLLLALGALLWNPDRPGHGMRTPVAKSPLEQRLERNARWMEAKSARERVEALNEVALAVKTEAFDLAQQSAGEELRKKLRLYQEVIGRLTGDEAPLLLTELRAEERKTVLAPIARGLQATESEAKRLALEKKDLADTLNELALVAAEGERKLRPLYA